MNLTNSNIEQIKQFRETHKNCVVEPAKLVNDDTHRVVIRCAYHADLIVASVPYRMFCMHLDKCAGHNSCPRNYSCCE